MQRPVGSQSSTSTSRPNFTHQQRSTSAHSTSGYPANCDVGPGSHLSSGSSSQWLHYGAASSTTSSEDWRFMGYSSGESLTSASASPKSAFYPSPAASPYSQSPYTMHHPNFHLHQNPLVLPPPSLDVPHSTSSTPGMLSPGLSTSLRSDYLPLTASSMTSTSTRTVSSEEDELTEAPEVDEALLQVPDNFAMVYPDVYRSSFPNKKHYAFLKNLGLKTVLTLVQEDYPAENKAFFKQNGTRFIQIGIPGNKVCSWPHRLTCPDFLHPQEPFVCIPDERIREALSVVLDKRNHPLLIHCNKGKHRTGCLVGCLRKMQCWSNTAVFDEYRRFSFPKSRQMDQLFIELFQPDWKCVDAAQLPEWCIGEAGISSPIQRPPNPYMPASEAPSESNSPITEQVPQCHSSICKV